MSLAEIANQYAGFKRLFSREDCMALSRDNIHEFAAAGGVAALLFVADPEKRPESTDVATILPELMDRFPSAFRLGIIEPDLLPEMMPVYGVVKLPSLIFIHEGNFLGVIPGLCDWHEYVSRMEVILATVAQEN